jgi:hypothetical protein
VNIKLPGSLSLSQDFKDCFVCVTSQAPSFAYGLSARKFRSTQYGARNAEATALDLSSVRHMINGAEPVDVRGMREFYDTFSKVNNWECGKCSHGAQGAVC